MRKQFGILAAMVLMTVPAMAFVSLDDAIILSRDERRSRPPLLEQIDGEGAPRNFKLLQDELIIGRAEEAVVRLLSARSSRHHAFLKRRGDEYVIRDNDSRNGVFLNGLKVHSAVLRDGDILQIADSVFAYHEA